MIIEETTQCEDQIPTRQTYVMCDGLENSFAQIDDLLD